MNSWTADLHYVLRSLLRSPGTTLVSVLVLTVGLTGATAVYTLVDQSVLHPLPYPDAARLVTLWSVQQARGGLHRTAYGTAESWSQVASLDQLAVADPTTFSVRTDAAAERLPGAYVSPEVFSILGTTADSGRLFGSAEAAQQQPVVVVSRDFAVERFGDAASAIGESIWIDGTPRRVLGVVPDRLDFPSKEVAIWAPHWTAPDWLETRDRHGLDSWLVLARLAPDATLDGAQRQLDRLGELLAAQHPAQYDGVAARIVPLARHVTGQDARAVFWTLLASVLVLLAIACANLAKLLLVRQQRRSCDSAVRLSLGAGVGKVARIPVLEATLLALAALALAVPSSLLLVHFVVERFPAAFAVAVDARPHASLWPAMAALVVFTVLVSSALPLWWTLRWSESAGGGSPAAASRATRRRGSLDRWLLSLEAAMALLLVWAGSLFFQSVVHLRGEPMGFDAQGLHLLEISLPRSLDTDRRSPIYDSITDELVALGPVEGVGAIEDLFTGAGFDLGFERDDGLAGRIPGVSIDAVTPGLFAAAGHPIVQGRPLVRTDRADGEDVAVVNLRFARALWPAAVDVVGRRFRLFDPDDGPGERPWITVVGVAADARREALWKPPLPQVFRPHAQRPSRNMNLLVAAALPTRELELRLREIVADLCPDAAVYGASTVAARLDRSIETQRLQAFLATAFSVVGLLIAALGIFGVTWQSVVERSRELAIRLAVGASPARLRAAVLGERLRDVAVGVAVGLGTIGGLESFVAASLHGVTPMDPATLLLAAAILGATGAVAAWVPARRAAAIDPSEALRSQ